jgi:hypothetical protein
MANPTPSRLTRESAVRAAGAYMLKTWGRGDSGGTSNPRARASGA